MGVLYSAIEPVVPGNHIDDWKKIRKGQWKVVRAVLKDKMDVNSEQIKCLKELYVTGCEAETGADLTLETPPLMGLWFSGDQSEVHWHKIWQAYVTEKSKGWPFDRGVKGFLKVAHEGAFDKAGNIEPYGAFGGLEQRVFKSLCQAIKVSALYPVALRKI